MVISTLNYFKEVSDVIAEPLTYIFNLSFETGIVPDLLKIAQVIPIYKKGERNLPSNYQPISPLSIFDKILEKLMYKDYLISWKPTKFSINVSLDLGRTIQHCKQ